MNDDREEGLPIPGYTGVDQSEAIDDPITFGRTEQEAKDIREAQAAHERHQRWMNSQQPQNQGADDREEGLPLPGQNQ